MAPKSSSPPSSSGPGDFAALLSQTRARTAPAEGQQTRPAHSDQPRRRDDDGARGRPAEAKDDTTSAAQARPADAPAAPEATEAGEPSTAADGQQAADPVAGAAAGDAATPVAQPADAQAAIAAGVVPPPATPAPGGGTPSAPTGAGDGTPGPAAGPAGPAAPVGAQAVLAAPAGPDAGGQAAGLDGAINPDGTPAGQLQLPAELLGAKAAGQPRHGKDVKNAGTPGDLPPAPTLPPGATAATGAAGTTPGGAGDAGANHPNNGAGAQAQPAMPPAVAGAEPAATPLTATPTGTGAPQLTRGSVVQTAERVQELVHIATTRAGNARATLQLRPEALGQVDVQLRTTRDGLVATIAAHDQAGLDALQNAAAELRRVLADRGVEVHSLDLQLGSGDSGFSNQGDARQANPGRGGATSYGLADDEDVVAQDELTITTQASTSAGALVDVTA